MCVKSNDYYYRQHTDTHTTISNVLEVTALEAEARRSCGQVLDVGPWGQFALPWHYFCCATRRATWAAGGHCLPVATV